MALRHGTSQAPKCSDLIQSHVLSSSALQDINERDSAGQCGRLKILLATADSFQGFTYRFECQEQRSNEESGGTSQLSGLIDTNHMSLPPQFEATVDMASWSADERSRCKAGSILYKMVGRCASQAWRTMSQSSQSREVRYKIRLAWPPGDRMKQAPGFRSSASPLQPMAKSANVFFPYTQRGFVDFVCDTEDKVSTRECHYMPRGENGMTLDGVFERRSHSGMSEEAVRRTIAEQRPGSHEYESHDERHFERDARSVDLEPVAEGRFSRVRDSLAPARFNRGSRRTHRWFHHRPRFKAYPTHWWDSSRNHPHVDGCFMVRWRDDKGGVRRGSLRDWWRWMRPRGRAYQTQFEVASSSEPDDGEPARSSSTKIPG